MRVMPEGVLADTGQNPLADNRPVVRAARQDDLDAIVSLELEAFHDAYESPHDPLTIAAVRRDFAARLEFLGSWARVLEIPGYGIAGMNMAYPIRLGLAELAGLCDQGRFMQAPEVIREILDEEGSATWGLVLAVAPSARMLSGLSFLAADMARLRAARGIRHTYFFSRLPGLARWVAQQMPDVRPAELPGEVRDTLAWQYFRTTVRRGSISRMADPLLAMYVDSGAVPVKLVSTWGDGCPARGIDMPSLGYKVLCERGPGAARKILEADGNHDLPKPRSFTSGKDSSIGD
jgi:hypothetical protein